MGRRIESLTCSNDWDTYYQARGPEQKIPAYLSSILKNEILNCTPGKIFELGCSWSPILLQCVCAGWEISGIDFNIQSTERFRSYLSTRGYSLDYLIADDVLTFDPSLLANQYDLLVSFGFLEHFNHPELILKKWLSILRRGGRVISVVPNLDSFNGRLLKYFDYPVWDKHVSITPLMLDMMHLQSSLCIISSARYYGEYDLNMLIPWDKIQIRCHSRLVLKIMRYTGSFILTPLIKTVGTHPRRLFSPIIYGVYSMDRY